MGLVVWFVVLPALVVLAAGIFLVVLGTRSLAKQRKTTQQRIEVVAYVVKFANWIEPQWVTFDYPLPDGTWRRETRMAAGMDFSYEKITFAKAMHIGKGFRFPVFVNPHDPTDVELSLRHGKGTHAVIWVGLGLLMAVGSASFVVKILSLALR